VDFEPQKGGVRTAIGARSVRVWGKRGAETPRSRLREVFLFPLPDTHNPHPLNALAPTLPLTIPRPLHPQNRKLQPQPPATSTLRTPPPSLKTSPSSFLDGLNAFFEPFSSLFTHLRSYSRAPDTLHSSPSFHALYPPRSLLLGGINALFALFRSFFMVFCVEVAGDG